MKTEKLELKHISKYFPYEVSFLNNKNDFELTINSITEESVFNNGNGHFDLDNIKLVLRPLEDLKKDEYFDLYMELCEEMETLSCEYLLEALINKTKYAFNVNNYEVLEDWMYKNHFDWKYDLIESGLAIDINTLTPKQ